MKNQPTGWNSHQCLPPNMRLMTTLSLIHLIFDKLKIQNDLTRNILKGKLIPRSWDLTPEDLAVADGPAPHPSLSFFPRMTGLRGRV